MLAMASGTYDISHRDIFDNFNENLINLHLLFYYFVHSLFFFFLNNFWISFLKRRYINIHCIICFRWQELEQEIADYPEFHRNDFTVVALPFLKNSTLPLNDNGRSDLSYLSTDCFHLNQKSNAQSEYPRFNRITCLIFIYISENCSWIRKMFSNLM